MRKLEIGILLEKVKEVPTLPSVANQLIRMTVNEDASIADLARLIETDQSLTLKVLKVANSPLYMGISRVRTVREAVVRLGMNALKSIVLSISVFDLVSLKKKDGLDWEKIWCHSLACAVCSKLVSSQVGLPYQEEAYLAGLLHDVGMVFLSKYSGESYREVVARVRGGGMGFDEVERELLGIDHATVGRWVLEKWGLSELVIKGVGMHHNPLPEVVERDPGTKLADIVCFSNLLCTEIGMGVVAGMTSPKASSTMLELVGITVGDVERIIPDLHKKVGSLAGLFGITPDLEKVYFDAVKSANFALGNMVLKMDRMNRSLEGRLTKLNVLTDILTDFLEASNYDRVLEILVKNSVEKLGFSRATASLRLSEDMTLTTQASSRPNGDIRTEKEIVSGGPEGIRKIELENLDSYASREIILDGEPRGKLWLYADKAEGLGGDDLDVLSALMKVVALAVTRVKALQNSVDEGEKLQEIIGRLNHAYQEIKTFEKKFKTVVENSSDMIFRADPGGMILSCNSACRDLLGYAEEELQKRTIYDLSDDPSLEEVLMRMLKEGDEVRNHNLTLTHRDGSTIYAGLSARGLKDHEGRLIEIVGVVRDLTKEKEKEEALIRTERMSALGEMACRIAHEFNNIFTLVLGRTELLLQQTFEEKTEKGLKIIEQVATRGVDTVRMVMEFARGSTNMTIEPLEVHSLVRKVIEGAKPKWKDEAEEKGIRIEMKEDLQEGLWIEGVESEITDALVNIVTNAVDAMESSGVISVKAKGEDGWVTITIEDSGKGMNEDVRRRIFEPFFSSKGIKSYGLGLSIAYGIVKRHGGRIDVASVPGKGSTFTIHLPRSENNDGHREVVNLPIREGHSFPNYR